VEQHRVSNTVRRLYDKPTNDVDRDKLDKVNKRLDKAIKRSRDDKDTKGSVVRLCVYVCVHPCTRCSVTNGSSDARRLVDV
jgi:hypothetical protein